MVEVVAADPSSGVSEVVVEQDGALRGKLRPGDVAFNANGLRCAVDVFGNCCWGATARHTSLEKFFENEDQVKIDYYGGACKDQEVIFFTLCIDAMRRVSDSALRFMRLITNCLEDPPCGHAAFLHYWSRRLAVAFTVHSDPDAFLPSPPARARSIFLLCV